MSYDTVNDAIELEGPKGPAKLVLIVLAYHQNSRTGECFPSVTTIAKLAAIKRDTVQAALKTLTAGGWITCQKQNGKSTRYTLNIQPVPKTALVDQQPVPKTGLVDHQPVPKTGLVDQSRKRDWGSPENGTRTRN